ncbi:MAG: hypothetical protein AB7S77_07995 [Desulfatirhabdiaceae bacterium]
MVKSLIRGAALSAMIVLLMMPGIVSADEIVAVDMKPGSCENSINVKSNGVTPFAILGAIDFDVINIDPVTVLIGEVVFDGFSYFLAEPVRPLRSGYEDVGTPDICDAGADGIVDMTLKFGTQAIVTALSSVPDVNIVENGNSVTLIFTGLLGDGTLFGGECVVQIKSKGKGKPNF